MTENVPIEIIPNATLDSIINGQVDGVCKKFSISSDGQNKNDYILLLSSRLLKSNKSTYLKVKLPYGKRDKILEVVTKLDKIITIYKISSLKKIDRDAFELDEIINTAKNTYNKSYVSFYGIIVLKEMPEIQVLSAVQKNLLNKLQFMPW